MLCHRHDAVWPYDEMFYSTIAASTIQTRIFIFNANVCDVRMLFTAFSIFPFHFVYGNSFRIQFM